MIGAALAIGHDREIQREPKQRVHHIGRHIGHQGERPGQQQEVRRIGPDVGRIIGAKDLLESGVVSEDSEMRSRIAGQREPTAKPAVGEIATDHVADGIVWQRRAQEIPDLENRNHDAGCERELEKQLGVRWACARKRRMSHGLSHWLGPITAAESARRKAEIPAQAFPKA